jgi:hypothetical protein
MTFMDIETLYPLVTDAIRHAETLEERDPLQANQAHLEVSFLEEQIAGLLPGTDQEGAVARRGAVSAAITAHHFERAQALAARFLAEDGLDRTLGADLARFKGASRGDGGS